MSPITDKGRDEQNLADNDQMATRRSLRLIALIYFGGPVGIGLLAASTYAALTGTFLTIVIIVPLVVFLVAAVCVASVSRIPVHITFGEDVIGFKFRNDRKEKSLRLGEITEVRIVSRGSKILSRHPYWILSMYRRKSGHPPFIVVLGGPLYARVETFLINHNIRMNFTRTRQEQAAARRVGRTSGQLLVVVGILAGCVVILAYYSLAGAKPALLNLIVWMLALSLSAFLIFLGLPGIIRRWRASKFGLAISLALYGCAVVLLALGTENPLWLLPLVALIPAVVVILYVADSGRLS